MKRIIFIMIFGIVLIGSVIAFTSLSSDIKVEKVEDVYSIYVLKEKISFDEIQNELSLYEQKRLFSLEYYNICINDCSGWCEMETKELNPDRSDESCIDECEIRCMFDKEYTEQLADKKILELNSILNSK